MSVRLKAETRNPEGLPRSIRRTADGRRVSPAGFVGGQGRTGQELEDLSAGLLWFLAILVIGMLVGAIIHLTFGS